MVTHCIKRSKILHHKMKIICILEKLAEDVHNSVH